MSLPPRGEGDGAGAAIPMPGVPPVSNMMDTEAMISAIMQMGFSREAAQLAVQQTGGNSVEAAISWVFENGAAGVSDAQMEQEGLYEEYKMVFVVNGSLSMGVGKTSAQVGHAAVDLYRQLISSQERFGGAVLQWNENGSKKVALRGESAEQLNELAMKADLIGLPNTTIADAGLTEIQAGSQTVLAIFGTTSKVDEVTGRLKLL